jgi:hypothetical protein
MATLACAAHAAAQHAGDINPSIQTGLGGIQKIRTNRLTEGGAIEPNAFVFESDFGDSGFPEFTTNPGFDAFPGTFQPGTRVGFNAPMGLYLWNASALEPVDTARLYVSFLTLETTIGPEPTAGFDLAVQSNGGWHRHFSFEIDDLVTQLPEPGVYVLPMQLYSTDKMVLTSDPFWMVFNYLASQEDQSTVSNWIEQNLVPPPCTADLDFDGVVSATDLSGILGSWGTVESNGLGDLDRDGEVGPSDIAILLGAWGACPAPAAP